MGRLLAVLAAIGMIAGAFVYRYGVPGGGSDGDGSRGGAVAGGKLVCAAELGEAVCDALGDGDEVLVEPASATADRLIKVRNVAEADVAGWLAPGPWSAMVDEERGRTSKTALFAKTGAGLASAPLVAVIRKPSTLAACPADVTWRCLGDAAQPASFRIGADALDTSSGLFIRAAATSGFFGNTDWAINDLDEQPEARSWLDNLNQRLAQAPGFGAGSLESFRLQRGSAAVYLSGGAAANSQPGNVDFDVRIPTPAVTIAVSLTPAARGARDVDTGPLLDPLRAAGWKVRSGAKNEGLPSPGVLLALRSS
jgi:hypothetical protein